MARLLTFLLLMASISSYSQQFILKGIASQTSPLIYQLTPDINNAAGMITNQYPLDLTKNFSLDFEINLGFDNNGADGIAFLLSTNCNPSLSQGQGLGVQNTPNSIIVDFDTYDNGFWNDDLSDDHIGIYSDGIFSSSNNIMDGGGGPLCMAPSCRNFETGQWDSVRIEWQFISTTSQKISVFINNILRATSTQNHILNRFNNQSTVFYSLAASTGGAKNLQQVRFPSNNNPVYCSGTPFWLYAPKLGTNYSWSNGNTSTTDSASFVATTPGTITCSYTDFCGQSRTVSFALNISTSIINPSSTQNLCLNSDPPNISVSTNTTSANAIKFVLFNSKQLDSNMYIGGTTLATVTPIAGIASYNPPIMGNAGSIPNVVGTYFVYAIANPAPANNLCRPFQEIIYNVNGPTSSSINQSICEGDSFLGRKTAGTYIDTLKNANAKGCDSIRTLILTINTKTTSTINQTICEGDSFLGRKIAGTYIDTLKNANAKGCDSIRTLNLTVNPKTFGSFFQTICEGDSVLFNNIQRKTSGSFIDTILNVKGCDSILTLNLNVNPKTFGSNSQTICEGDSVLFNGVQRKVSGSFLDTFVNSKGCDSIHTLNLTVNPKTFSSFSQTICEGDSFLFNNIQRKISGSYLDTFINSKGCDSIRTLNLTVNPKTFGTISRTICQGDSFLFNNIQRKTSGTYLDTILNAKGCDSFLNLNLTVNPKTFGAFSQTICEGDSFLFNGIQRKVAGTYLDTIANIKGCDSFLTLTLSVNPKTFSSFSQTICEGDSFQFNNIQRKIAGTYLGTFINSKGCDSIRTLNLTVNPKTFSSFSQTICEGDSFQFNNIFQKTSGVYQQIFVNAKGCDSIRTLNLTVNLKTFSSFSQTICEGDSILYNNIQQKTSGSYLDTFINAKGCDSIRTLILTVNPKTFSTINQTICEGSSFLGRTVSGTYSDTLKNANAKGCDSIRTLNLTVNPKTFSTISQTICEGTSFLGRNVSGTYKDTLKGQNANGCDSIRTLILTVNNRSFTTINRTICFGDSFERRNASGTYLDTFSNQLNCDSIRTLNLIVLPKNEINYTVSICQGDSFLGRKIAGVYNDTFKDSKACDSIRVLTLIVNNTSTFSFSQTICEGDSFLGKKISGIYRDTLQNAKGCDSFRTLTLTVLPKNIVENITICEGKSYRGHTIDGNYLDTFIDNIGCEKISQLTLKVTKTTYSTSNQTICFGGKYLGHTTSGIYRDTIQNTAGCDSVRTLNLTVRPSIIINPLRDTSICENDSITLDPGAGFILYTWDNNTTKQTHITSESGLHFVKLMDKNRCVEADSAYITFYKKPNIFIGNDTLLYGSDKIEIIPDLSIPTNKAGLKWSPKTLLSCDTCFSQYFSINKPEIVSVIYKDLNGCLASDSIFIDYIKEGAIAFPSAFSPNGDFKNDVFTYNGEGVKKIQYKIFNRWGEKVFESNSIEDKWDGTYKNEPQPNENYVYVSAITLINNKVLVLKGSVALIR